MGVPGLVRGFYLMQICSNSGWQGWKAGCAWACLAWPGEMLTQSETFKLWIDQMSHSKHFGLDAWLCVQQAGCKAVFLL